MKNKYIIRLGISEAKFIEI